MNVMVDLEISTEYILNDLKNVSVLKHDIIKMILFQN